MKIKLPLFSCIACLFFFLVSVKVAAQEITVTHAVSNISSGAEGAAEQHDILGYSTEIHNFSGGFISQASLVCQIPAGVEYIAGSTSLNGQAVSDVSGRMPYAGNGGFINSPSSPQGTIPHTGTAVISYRVRVTANGGSITSSAVLQYEQFSQTSIKSSNAVFTTVTEDAGCSIIYQFTSSGGYFPVTSLRTLDLSNGTGSGTLYSGNSGGYDALTGEALGTWFWGMWFPTSVLGNSAAMAYDKTSNRIYFVNNGAASSEPLCYLDLNVSPIRAYRYTGHYLGTSGSNINRMAYASDGYGYAVTSDAGELNRFHVGEDNLPVIEHLGPLINDVVNGDKDITSDGGGDIFADGSGNLYLVANSSNLYRINPGNRVATFLGTLGESIAGQSASIAMDAKGNVYIGGSYQDIYRLDLTSMMPTRINSGTSNVYASTDFGSCAFPVLAPALNAVKTYYNVSGSIGVVLGDTVEYRIEVVNTGNINAAGVKLYDGIPLSTNYIAGSTKLNGIAVADDNGQMPFAVAGGRFIYSEGQQDGIIRPGVEQASVLTFQTRTEATQQVCNQSRITLMDAEGNTIFINTTTPETPAGQEPTCFLTSGVLPDSRLSFKAVKTPAANVLEWRLSDEKNLIRYELESADDGRNFRYAGALPAVRNPVYEFVDRTPMQSPQRFYRLRLVYANGTASYSSTIKVMREAARVIAHHFFPNPFSTSFRYIAEANLSGNIEIRVKSMSGALLHSVRYSRLAPGQQVINGGKWPVGIYLVELWKNGILIARERMVKQ